MICKECGIIHQNHSEKPLMCSRCIRNGIYRKEHGIEVTVKMPDGQHYCFTCRAITTTLEKTGRCILCHRISWEKEAHLPDSARDGFSSTPTRTDKDTYKRKE